MANIVYDLIPPAELIQYVRAYENEVLRAEGQFVLDAYLPNFLTDDLEFKIRRGAFNDVDIAEYRAFDTPAKMTQRPGTRRIAGSLGPVSRQIPLGEEETLRVRSLQANSNDPLVDAIYADSERMIRSVAARIEVARGDVIDDGRVTIAENGLQLTADFGRAAPMSVTAANLWTNASTGKPVTDMLTWQEAYVDQNGVAPDHVLMPKQRVSSLCLNAEVRSFAAGLGGTPARVNRATLDDIISNEGLPPIVLFDGQFRVDGVRTRVLPVNKVYFMPAPGEALGNTMYGVTAEALKLAGKGYISMQDAPGLVAVVTENDHPVQTYTVGTGLALPAMANPDLILDAVVA